MEVMKMNETIKKEREDKGCFTQPYTINGEKWLYIIHPAESKRKSHE